MYLPEGSIVDTRENRERLCSVSALKRAFEAGTVLEERAYLFDADKNLLINLGSIKGIMPYSECAAGLEDGAVREIAVLSRVGKPVSFVITGFESAPDGTSVAKLSRRVVQQRCIERYIERLRPGDVICGRITHMQSFGCFVDIGCGISALLPIDLISVSRISHPSDRFRVGDRIRCVVKTVDSWNRVLLSHKELLGTWLENASAFRAGETVTGIIRSVEEYGVFIELAANLAGLSDLRNDAKPGKQASVYIKSIQPDTMKIKLAIIDVFEAPRELPELTYRYCKEHISSFRYSPEGCRRLVETVFDDV